jgi:hypothetical protein
MNPSFLNLFMKQLTRDRVGHLKGIACLAKLAKKIMRAQDCGNAAA